MCGQRRVKRFPSFIVNFYWFVCFFLHVWFLTEAVYLHSTHDIDGLSFATMANVLQARDGTQQVRMEPQLIKVLLAEQFNMRGQEILGKITQCC